MAVKRVGGLGRGVNALISSGDDMIVDGASSIGIRKTLSLSIFGSATEGF